MLLKEILETNSKLPQLCYNTYESSPTKISNKSLCFHFIELFITSKKFPRSSLPQTVEAIFNISMSLSEKWIFDIRWNIFLHPPENLTDANKTHFKIIFAIISCLKFVCWHSEFGNSCTVFVLDNSKCNRHKFLFPRFHSAELNKSLIISFSENVNLSWNGKHKITAKHRGSLFRLTQKNTIKRIQLWRLSFSLISF